MKGQAPAYWFDATSLVRGLFDSKSDEHSLLQLSSCNVIELHATKKTWNSFLWLMMNHLKQGGTPTMSGKELGELRRRLPIEFH
tara:strand:+ start:2092 stop:2343 length:252 start_codon:yes stop_codon:yes gene_type:complete